MTDFLPSYFHLNIPFFVLFILAITAGIATYYYYRKTIPPITDKIRFLLGILRGIALFLILSLFFSPQITLVWQNELKPEVVLLVDNSASMGIKDHNQERFTEAKSIAFNIEDQIKNTNKVTSYFFNIDTSSTHDTSIVSNLATNVDKSLKMISAKHKTAESIILISDGIITEGSNPLFSTTLKKHKIHTIGIGDTSESPDILIKNVIANKTVYKNNPTSISAEITTKNLVNFSSTVKLTSKNKTIAAKKLDINNSDQIYPVEFEIIPEKSGLVTYQLQVEEFINEKFTENNVFSVQLEVLKDKLHVGLLANQPGYDLKFIKQIIQSDKNLKLSSFIGLNPNARVQQMTNIIDSSDVLVIIDFPGKNTPQSIVSNFTNLIESRRIPICFFIQSIPARSGNALLKNRFPDFSFSPLSSPINVFCEPTISGKLNPVFNIFDNAELNNAFWQNTAPVEYSFNNIRIGETDKVLLQNKDNANHPVLISNTKKGLNNLLFLGIGFWRWKFLLAEDRQYSSAYETIFNNLIKWIAKNPGTNNVNIEANKKGLPLGEELITNVQVYDASFNIVENGEIKLTVTSPDGDFEAIAKNTGNGNYQWIFRPMVEGNYLIKADAYKNDVLLGSNQIEINVLPVSSEFLITKQDTDFLKKLAAFTSGNFFTSSNYKEIFPILPKTPNVVETSRNYDLWNKLYTLLLIIFLLSVEWFIRKRKGLA